MNDERDYLARLRGYADLFYSYFPTSQSERDLVLLRGHQLIEALVFQFLRQHVNSPDELENFHARWDAVLALARSLRYQNGKTKLGCGRVRLASKEQGIASRTSLSPSVQIRPLPTS